ncbi:WbqC family protein [Paenisporosarcina macmurdoensis]|uniref:WbqC family protein n=1 Tax=Paenisporosarcina macmurdoensis TaxID=212659 RepID=A0ABW1L7A8_9BACL
MKIVLMQPYFFPYIGYYTLIKQSDIFVVFDTAQYIRRGWVNRNRILGTNGEPIYINASIVKAPRETPINEIKLSESSEWKENILKKLEVYKHLSPYYDDVRDLVRECLENQSIHLSDLNINTLKKINNFLGIKNNITRLSDLDIEFKDIQQPDDWGLQLSKFFNAESYINAPGGENIYSKDKYLQQEVELNFYKNNLNPYDQKHVLFQKGLSIIDVMMFNSKTEIIDMIDDYRII